jgi:hypothetical protein
VNKMDSMLNHIVKGIALVFCSILFLILPNFILLLMPDYSKVTINYLKRIKDKIYRSNMIKRVIE